MTREGGARGAHNAQGGQGGRRAQGASKKRVSPTKASIARINAYTCLDAIRRRDAFANDVIDKVIDRSQMPASDRAFATRLVLGVVSMRGALNHVLNGCMRSPKDVQPDVREALLISTYEILYLDKDAHAAVDQGVELVRFVQPKATGVANALLHKVVKAKRDFPFGDPAKSIDAYALANGFPAWLVKKVFQDLGPNAAHAFVAASNDPSPVFIAVNALRISDEEAMSELRRIDPGITPVDVEGMPIDGCYLLSDAKAVADGRFKRMASRGEVLVSDAAAQAVAHIACKAVLKARLAAGAKRLGEGGGSAKRDGAGVRGALGDRPALSCLELCAGRGTKTVLLQSDMRRFSNDAPFEHVAVDNVPFKIRLLEERAERCGCHLDKAICADATELCAAVGGRTFELVFLDSPCTGIGTLRRHPEIRWRVSPEAISQYAGLDGRLLASAAQYVSPGGILAYSTCTITREENELAVRAFLDSPDGSSFKLIPVHGRPVFKTSLVPNGYDAHFCALLQKQIVR